MVLCLWDTIGRRAGGAILDWAVGEGGQGGVLVSIRFSEPPLSKTEMVMTYDSELKIQFTLYMQQSPSPQDTYIRNTLPPPSPLT